MTDTAVGGPAYTEDVNASGRVKDLQCLTKISAMKAK